MELATRTKMFCRAQSPALSVVGGEAAQRGGEEYAATDGLAPNTCIDPVVLGLPGALPVPNRAAVEMSIRVGLALGCSIAEVTRWDRKSYFYPDLPKGYQISQFDLPLCFDGAFDLPAPVKAGPAAATGPVAVDWTAPPRRIGILRAHLEEDAGKLLHEAPGGGAIDFSIADYNRAGTPLLEIVTQPDFTTAEEVVLFCQVLRDLCRALGVTEGVMQKGHIRFEPNINLELTLADGRTVATPIVEVKNLNSFRAVKGAIEFEAREQPGRFLETGRVFGPGTKETRGWDDIRLCTVVQREKEDAHDYRYFPDPDLLPVRIGREWVEAIRAALPEPPLARLKRYRIEYGLGEKEAAALLAEPRDNAFYEDAVAAAARCGLDGTRAGKVCANLVLQSGARRVNEAAAADPAGSAPRLVSELGIHAVEVGAIAALRDEGVLSAAASDALFGELCGTAPRTPARPLDLAALRSLAQERGLLTLRDDAALAKWVAQAIAENAKAAEDVRAGKDAAIGRIVGAVMKLAGGKAEAAAARQAILKALRP